MFFLDAANCFFSVQFSKAKSSKKDNTLSLSLSLSLCASSRSRKMEIPNVMIWSHPRAMSTAFLRSFEGPKVYDSQQIFPEPILQVRWRAFLDPDAGYLEKSFGELFDKFEEKGPFVWKEHTYHLNINNWTKIEEEKERLKKMKHIVIIRHPERSVSSMIQMKYKLGRTSETATDPNLRAFYEDWGVSNFSLLEEILFYNGGSYRYQAEIFDMLVEMGEDPLVVDADDLISNPQPYLDELCKRAQFPWKGEDMMEWEGKMANAHPVVQPWFEVANESNCLTKKNLKSGEEHLSRCPPESRESILKGIQEILPLYQKLKKHAITIDVQ